MDQLHFEGEIESEQRALNRWLKDFEQIEGLRLQLTLEKHSSPGLKTLELKAESELDAFASESYDFILARKLFMRLMKPEERQHQMAEVTRVLKPSGLLFAEFIPRLGGLSEFFHQISERPSALSPGACRSALENGIFRWAPQADKDAIFSMSLKEACHFFLSTGLSEVEVLSLRGLFSGRESSALRVKAENPSLFAEMLEVVAQTSHLTSVIETCGPALFVARKERSL